MLLWAGLADACRPSHLLFQIAYPVYSFLLPVYSFWRFDDFSWGNTRVVVGEGATKKVLQAEDEAFDESTIPLAKFSDYEAALADEHFDTRSEKSHSTAGFSLATRLPQGAYQRSEFAPPYAGGGGGELHSRHASRSTMQLPQMPMQGYGGYPGAPGSVYGGVGGGQGSVMGGGSEFGYPMSVNPYMNAATLQSQMSLAGGFAPQVPPPPMSSLPRRQSGMSAFSYGAPGTMGAQSVYSMNPFANPPAPVASDDADPSDEALFTTLQAYLAGQDRASPLSLPPPPSPRPRADAPPPSPRSHEPVEAASSRRPRRAVPQGGPLGPQSQGQRDDRHDPLGRHVAVPFFSPLSLSLFASRPRPRQTLPLPVLTSSLHALPSPSPCAVVQGHCT